MIHCDLGLFRGFFFQNITKLCELRDLDIFSPQEFLLDLISRVGFLLGSCDDRQSLAQAAGYC